MEYKMYCLVERHLSPLQKGIQSAHAIIDYQLKYGNLPQYQNWSNYHKTMVVLDCGTAQDMQATLAGLAELQWPHEVFLEPDLNNLPTAICFLVNEKVWDYRKYGRSYEDYNFMTTCDPNLPKWTKEEWVNWIGGEKCAIMKNLISTLKIAQ